jgi:hypothetical protein
MVESFFRLLTGLGTERVQDLLEEIRHFRRTEALTA